MFLQPALWFCAIELAAWTAGWPLYRRVVRSQQDRLLEAIALPLVLGLAVLGTLAFWLAACQILHRGVLIGGVLGLDAAGLLLILRHRQELRGLLAQTRRPDPWFLPSAGILLLYLPWCFSPLIPHDSLVYHLTIPRVYLDHGGFVAMPYNLFFHMPHNVELLYSWCLAGGDAATATLLGHQFHVLILAGLAIHARRWLRPELGGLLGLLYLSGPNVHWQLASTHVEPAIGCWLLFDLLLLLQWREERRTSQLVLAAALAGWLLGCKYTTWFFVPGLAAALAWMLAVEMDRTARRWRLALLSMIAAVVMILPWLIKNLLYTGNPIYPNLYGLLGGRWWSAAQDMQLMRSMAWVGTVGHEPTLLWRLSAPWHLVRSPMIYLVAPLSATLMGLFIAAVALPSSYRGHRKYVLLVSLASFVGFLLSPAKQGRFLTATTPLMVCAAGLVLDRMWRWRSLRWAAGIAVVAGCFLQFDSPKKDWSSLYGEGYRAEAASANLVPLWERLHRELPPHARLLLCFENRIYFLKRAAWTDSLYEGPSSMALLREAGSAAEAARRLRRAGITHIVVQWHPARRYLDQKLPIDLTHPLLLPPEQFERERQNFYRLLQQQTVHLFDLGEHSVYELRRSNKIKGKPEPRSDAAATPRAAPGRRNGGPTPAATN